MLPWIAGVGPDPARTLDGPRCRAATRPSPGTRPRPTYPEGTYMLRVEAYRAAETLHYAQHQEKIYVNR